MAEPSISAFGASGEVKLAFAMPGQEISYPLDVHGDPTELQYAWVRNGDTTLATAPNTLTSDKVLAPPKAGGLQTGSAQKRRAPRGRRAHASLFSSPSRRRKAQCSAVTASEPTSPSGLLAGRPRQPGFLQITPADVNLPITKHLRGRRFSEPRSSGRLAQLCGGKPQAARQARAGDSGDRALARRQSGRRHRDRCAFRISRARSIIRRSGDAARDSQHQYGDAATSQSTPTATEKSPRSTAVW